eukprot:639082-Karenia_brevis.AAC.1
MWAPAARDLPSLVQRDASVDCPGENAAKNSLPIFIQTAAAKQLQGRNSVDTLFDSLENRPLGSRLPPEGQPKTLPHFMLPLCRCHCQHLQQSTLRSFERKRLHPFPT